MPYDKNTKRNYAATKEEGQLYLPQVSFVSEVSEGGAPIYTVCYKNLHTDAQSIIRRLKKGERVARYHQDGSTHQNREKRFPTGGTYKEYRIEPRGNVPGKTTASAHRIVHRTDTNVFYYTGFHYADPHKVTDIP